MRVGMGYDVHRLVEGRKLIIGGVEIPYEKGLLGHSDADVLLHAIMDALLGAAALGDIGKHFPDTDERYKGADSMKLLSEVKRLLEEKLYIIEELDPFMEDEIKAAGIDCVGKELTGKLYELNTELVRERVLGIKPAYKTVDEVKVAKRPPALCPGCPHRGFFYTLSKNKNYVVTGDIGCYTLGFAPPLNCMDVCICMGGGFSAGMGMAKSFQREGVTDKVVFGVMGDSTFFHSGMTGAAEIIYNNGRMIPCVLDNRITGMTGHQDNPGSGFTLMGEPAPMISVEKVLEAYGFAPVFTVDPQDLTAMKKTVDDAVAALNEGKHPAIVTRRPCLLIKRVKHDTGMCVVNADKCKSCKSCLKVGCPAISMENGKAFIDRTQCVGCTVCAQACPFGAIEKEEK